MPSDARLGEPSHEFGVFACDVGRFAAVFFDVEELRLRTVVLAQKLPFAVPHSKIRKILVPVKGIAVGWAAKEYRRLAGDVALAE